jgi:hypothetical protein
MEQALVSPLDPVLLNAHSASTVTLSDGCHFEISLCQECGK